jgi:hypothetical protein
MQSIRQQSIGLLGLVISRVVHCDHRARSAVRTLAKARPLVNHPGGEPAASGVQVAFNG